MDYSKYHDVRIDNQLATDTLVPDVVQLQTLQDFVRWKDAGVLRPYKPAGFSAVYPHFRDPDGAWVAIAVCAFSYMYDASLGSAAPATPADLADPRWKGAIASSYPNDDDAVLYLYKLYAEAYGWDWVSRLAALNIEFGRGTPTPIIAVASKQKLIGIGGAGSLTAPAGARRTVGRAGRLVWGSERVAERHDGFGAVRGQDAAAVVVAEIAGADGSARRSGGRFHSGLRSSNCLRGSPEAQGAEVPCQCFLEAGGALVESVECEQYRLAADRGGPHQLPGAAGCEPGNAPVDQ